MIDEIDVKILHILQKDGRISNVDIARQLGMAPSGVLGRRRRLERKGVIVSYETRVNAEMIGLGLTTFIHVKTDEPVGRRDVGERMSSLPQIQEIYFIAGEYNYLVKARVADTQGLTALLEDLGAIDMVRDTRTTLVLENVKEGLALGLELAQTKKKKTRRKRQV